MSSDSARKPADGIQVIARAARLLRALEGSPEGLSLAQIAVRTELPRSTVHRLVMALQAEGFVAAASPNGRVRLGPELLRLAGGRAEGLKTELRPLMQRLSEALTETVDLAVLDAGHLRFIEQIPAPHRLRAVSAVGATFPLHCTANGKAMLSLLPRETVEGLLPARLPAFTAATITSRRSLLRELAAIRVIGVAVDREEHTHGISAVGFAMSTPDAVVAAISVPMPTQRFAGREADLVAQLQSARAEVELRLATS